MENEFNHVIFARDKRFIPERGSEFASGMDCFADIPKAITLWAGQRTMIPLGFKVAMQPGYHMDIRPRSGLALKHGITVLNSPGLIDADYRGIVCAIMINHADESYEIQPGDKICQAVISRNHSDDLILAMNYSEEGYENFEELFPTDRGAGGLGSTGY
jgi:dUTP pyrophosphatase